MEFADLVTLWDRDCYVAGEDAAAFLYLAIAPTKPPIELEQNEVHYGLILDVSSSMNSRSKYPIMLEALREFAKFIGDESTISVVTFSNVAEIVVPMAQGSDAVLALSAVDQTMRASHNFFGHRTLLAPALSACLTQMKQIDDRRAKRVLILTDGEIHDFDASCDETTALGSLGADVALYGFGDQFNAEQLWSMIQSVPGATAKPILDTAQAVYTFGHWARQGRRIVAHNARLVVEFAAPMLCGEACVVEPVERHLGQLQSNRFLYEIGNLEWNRRYGFLFELRLPFVLEPEHIVATADLFVDHGARAAMRQEIVVARSVKPGQPNSLVTKLATAMLTRDQGKEGQLRALRARRDLYRSQGRSQRLLAALDAQIRVLTSDGKVQLSEEHKKELRADKLSENSQLFSLKSLMEQEEARIELKEEQERRATTEQLAREEDLRQEEAATPKAPNGAPQSKEQDAVVTAAREAPATVEGEETVGGDTGTSSMGGNWLDRLRRRFGKSR